MPERAAAPLPRVGILYPGSMGAAIGEMLVRSQVRVSTWVLERSAASHRRATDARIECLSDLETLVASSDVLLSIVPPDAAFAVAERVAEVLDTLARPAPLVYADCNAIAPQLSRRIAARIEDTGARYVDAAIIGPPPRSPHDDTTRIYACGPAAAALAALHGRGLHLRLIDEPVGAASALKMSYAALTKGTTAIFVQLLAAAQANGVLEALGAEMRLSQPEAWARSERDLAGLPPRAYRWVGEMLQIADTFEDAGLDGGLFRGAAAVYEAVAALEGEGGIPATREALAAALVPRPHEASEEAD